MKKLAGCLAGASVLLALAVGCGLGGRGGTASAAAAATDYSKDPATLIGTLWKTGVDDDGTPLPAGSVDPHWTFYKAVKGTVQQGTFDPTSPVIVGDDAFTTLFQGDSAYVISDTSKPSQWNKMLINNRLVSNWIGFNSAITPDNYGGSLNPASDPSDPLTGGSADYNWTAIFQMNAFQISDAIDPSTVALTVNGLADNNILLYDNGENVPLNRSLSFDGDVYYANTTSSSAFVNGSNVFQAYVEGNWPYTGLDIGGWTVKEGVKYFPKLKITKTIDNPTIKVGQTANYLIKIQNVSGQYGQPTSGNLTVKDTVPDNYQIVKSSLSSGCTASGQTVVCTSNVSGDGALSNLTGSDQNYGTVGFTVKAVKDGTDISNTASVYGGGDPSCTQSNPCVSAAVGGIDTSCTEQNPCVGVGVKSTVEPAGGAATTGDDTKKSDAEAGGTGDLGTFLNDPIWIAAGGVILAGLIAVASKFGWLKKMLRR
ncbi:MAG: DUF11 domain-containing protein [Candidatus Nomurabacteria bacterium]|jgi:uncharacterized repeat protein (TIGR01451 family)|nr:DUF11 domain-containing protein [Candidatus Nomurabacteria bacterium]